MLQDYKKVNLLRWELGHRKLFYCLGWLLFISGFYSLEGVASCTPCPKGYYCDDTSAKPVICPTGTYSASTGLNIIKLMFI